MIAATDLCIDFEGRRALGPLTGSFGDGTLVVAGAAGSGKTTLLKALCGLIAPSAGKVEVDGEDLARAGPDALDAARARFGFVFQNDALFDSLDALANTALPLSRRGALRPEAEARAREALAQVGLAGQERTLPERMSGGMKKRLGLARAIAARPRYLVADDPLAGLDPATAAGILELMLGLSKDRGGLVVAASDPGPLWDRCDELLVLAGGQVVARGPARASDPAMAATRREASL